MGKIIDKIKSILKSATPNEVNEIKYQAAEFTENPPLTGGNLFNYVKEQNATNDVIYNNAINIALANQKTTNNGNNTQSEMPDLFESSIEAYWLFDYEAQYYINTINFECEDKETYAKIKIMLRAAFKSYRACLFKREDKIAAGLVTDINYNMYNEIESLSILPLTNNMNIKGEKWYENHSNIILHNIKPEDVALFNWGSSGTSNWVTIYRTCLHQKKLLDMMITDSYSYLKKLQYSVASPFASKKELADYFNTKISWIEKPLDMNMNNKLEWSESGITQNPNQLIEFYKQWKGIWNSIYGRRTNNDFKKERSVSKEISLTEDNYLILEKDWLDEFKVFIERAKKIGVNITYIEPDEMEIDNEFEDIQTESINK